MKSLTMIISHTSDLLAVHGAILICFD